ncbi:hypothetical protein [Pseudidiomarina mangrovi]|uniref:hypothetical protein n=1 Tax=Pseudidiomarina mangrovi TaxID=2487133 RepID=UPI000FCB856F|nr:hypothetical protein [Pseudidiomarina mangrovi]
MDKLSRSPAEQQLSKRLQQAAAAQVSNEPALAWPLPTASNRRWAWGIVPLATAAAVAWLVVGDYTLSPTLSPTQPQQYGASTPPMLMAENYQLEALDQRIQYAYLSGADEQTISQLWAQRAYWTAKDRINQEWTQ